MIKIKQVDRAGGQVELTVEFNINEETKTVTIDAEEVVHRLRIFYALMGKRPSLAEVKMIFVKLIQEHREGKRPWQEIIPWENFISQDLEA